jgi:hypothetical protein
MSQPRVRARARDWVEIFCEVLPRDALGLVDGDTVAVRVNRVDSNPGIWNAGLPMSFPTWRVYRSDTRAKGMGRWRSTYSSAR